MTRSRFIGSGPHQQGGFLATHKQDFVAHITGGDWRHTADQIDLNPVLPAPYNGTVQNALNHLTGIVPNETSQNVALISGGYPISLNSNVHNRLNLSGNISGNINLNITLTNTLVEGYKSVLIVDAQGVVYNGYRLNVIVVSPAVTTFFSGADAAIYSSAVFKFDYYVSRPSVGNMQLIFSRTDYV